jgi:hypothetical protein
MTQNLLQLNPDVRTLKIGKKDLEEKEILPLSFTDQRKLLQTIVSVIAELVPTWETATQTVVISEMRKVIEDNIELIVGMIYDGDKEEFMSKMTNDQLVDLIDIVWEVNYQFPLDKGTMTIQKIMKSLKKPSSKPSPQSVSPTDTP